MKPPIVFWLGVCLLLATNSGHCGEAITVDSDTAPRSLRIELSQHSDRPSAGSGFQARTDRPQTLVLFGASGQWTEALLGRQPLPQPLPRYPLPAYRTGLLALRIRPWVDRQRVRAEVVFSREASRDGRVEFSGNETTLEGRPGQWLPLSGTYSAADTSRRIRATRPPNRNDWWIRILP